MLDNPNLSTEKMLEVMAHGTDIIGILLILVLALLIYLYRYEIGLFLKYGFSKKKNDLSLKGISNLLKTDISDLEKMDFNDKIDNMLHSFENPVLDDEDMVLIKSVDNLMHSNNDEIYHPIFRSLKTLKTSNEITYYFVNDGGAIHDIRTNHVDGIKISIEPKNSIEKNESGYFKFELLTNSDGDEIHFDLSYKDNTDKLHENKYRFSTIENKLSTVGKIEDSNRTSTGSL